MNRRVWRSKIIVAFPLHEFCTRITENTVMNAFGPLAIILIFLLPSPGLAESYSGKVIGMSDEDPISVMHNGRAEKVRLDGILKRGKLSGVAQGRSLQSWHSGKL